LINSLKWNRLKQYDNITLFYSTKQITVLVASIPTHTLDYKVMKTKISSTNIRTVFYKSEICI